MMQRALLLAVFALIFESASAAAQPAGRCLGNTGDWTVDPGASYTDPRGVWVCAPEHPQSTAGGWVLIEEAPAPASGPSATSKPSGVPHLVWILAPVGLLAGLAVALGMRRLIQRERLTGSLVIEQENRHG